MRKERLGAMDSKKENNVIAETIKFFVKGNFRERKPYLKDLHSENGVTLNGFTFKRDIWCWLVWKSTNLADSPEFKGEPLIKVVPVFTPFENIPIVLDSQPWTYL